MTTFDERESAYETKYAKDKETEFKIMAYARRLLGKWAAQQMRLGEEEATAYAEEVLKASIGQGTTAVDKIATDFGGKAIGLGKSEIIRQREIFYQQARFHFLGEEDEEE